MVQSFFSVNNEAENVTVTYFNQIPISLEKCKNPQNQNRLGLKEVTASKNLRLF